MTKKTHLFFILLFLLVPVSSWCQNGYQLKHTFHHSTLSAALTTRFDSLEQAVLMEQAFTPVPGKHTVLVFIEAFYGESPAYLPDSTVIIELHDVVGKIIYNFKKGWYEAIFRQFLVLSKSEG